MEAGNGRTQLLTWTIKQTVKRRKLNVLMPVECAVPGCREFRLPYHSYCQMHRNMYLRLWRIQRQKEGKPFRYDGHDKVKGDDNGKGRQ